MSAASIDKKISKAYAKVANILGVDFGVYRPVAFTAPISPQNWISDQKAAFSLDEKFAKNRTSKFDLYEVSTDTTSVQPGDIFVNDDDTFIIINRELFKKTQAIRSNRTITVTRLEYTGATKAFTDVVTDVPANVQYGVTGDLNVQPASSTSKSTKPVWEIRIWAPDDTIRLNDVLVDSKGNRSRVRYAQWSPLGYVLKTEEEKA